MQQIYIVLKKNINVNVIFFVHIKKFLLLEVVTIETMPVTRSEL